jgi:hypothetical protein
MPVSHDALAYRKAETFSRTDALRGKERLKDEQKNFPRTALPGKAFHQRKAAILPLPGCKPYPHPSGPQRCRIAKDAARCTIAASVPDKFRIFPKFLKNCEASDNLIIALKRHFTDNQHVTIISHNRKNLYFLRKCLEINGSMFRTWARISHNPIHGPFVLFRAR